MYSDRHILMNFVLYVWIVDLQRERNNFTNSKKDRNICFVGLVLRYVLKSRIVGIVVIVWLYKIIV